MYYLSQITPWCQCDDSCAMIYWNRNDAHFFANVTCSKQAANDWFLGDLDRHPSTGSLWVQSGPAWLPTVRCLQWHPWGYTDPTGLWYWRHRPLSLCISAGKRFHSALRVGGVWGRYDGGGGCGGGAAAATGAAADKIIIINNNNNNNIIIIKIFIIIKRDICHKLHDYFECSHTSVVNA